MKSIFIVSSYPSNDKKIKVLKETLISIRNVGYDVLLTTNYPIKDQEIYGLVDYLIYDKTDIQNFYEYGIFNPDAGWYAHGSNFDCTVSFDNAYHFDLYRSIYNGVSLANSLGYEYFNYIEGDCVLLNPLMPIEIREKLISENKKLFFVQVEMKESREYTSYATHFFGGNCKYFIENSRLPFELEKWIAVPGLCSNGMEVSFYENFKHVSDQIMILPFYSKDDIIINKIRKIDDHGLKHILFFNEVDCYLYFINANENDVNIKLYIDDILFRNYNLRLNHYNIEKIDINSFLDKRIKLEINMIGEIDIFEKIFDEKYINIMKKTQKINFH